MFANINASIVMDGKILIDAPATVTESFVKASRNAVLYAGSTASIATNATVAGTRYVAKQGGVISTGGSETYFPGTVAGSVSTGGVYS